VRAATFGVRPGNVLIISGDRARDEVVALDPAPPDAPATLDRLRDNGP